MPVPRFFAQLQSFTAGAAAVIIRVFGEFFQKVRDFILKARPPLHGLFNRLTDKIPPEKHRLVMLTVAGVFVTLILIIAAAFLAGMKESQPVESSVIRKATPRGVIPPDELFLPDEPDFIPGVMTEREKRNQWTAADALPFWHDPLKDGEEQWRDLIEETADAILEDVP